jgi:hypothetical protein
MFWATLAPDSDSLKLWHALFPGETEQDIECLMSQTGGWGGRRGPKGGGWVKFEDDFDSSILGYGEPFDMPSKSGSTREFRDNDGAHSEFLSITVEDTPQDEGNGSASAAPH